MIGMENLPNTRDTINTKNMFLIFSWLKESVLRNFAKFTGKHLCQGPFFSKVAGFRPATLLKKKL